MRRRDFIEAAAACVAAWPTALRAQQKTSRIGVLLLGSIDGGAEAVLLQVLRDELRKSGYVEGQNVRLDLKSADGSIDRLPRLAADLVALKVDVIAAFFTPCAHAAQQATRDVRIVVLAGDALGTGLVTSLARPGGNITGVSAITGQLHGKCVELLHDMLPSARRIGALINVADTSSKIILEQVRDAGKITSVEIAPAVPIRTPDEIDAAFATLKKEGAEAVVVQGSLPVKLTAELALKHQLPAGTAFRPFAEAGGLMSYSASFDELFRMAALCVVKILHGAKPADLPIEQPTRFELVINLKTANSLGVSVPATLLNRADDVID